MSIPTVPVTCTAYDQNGNPVAGAVFTARLSATETYQGFVVPELYEGTANDSGVCVINLFPNALGVAGSSYLITATNPDTGKKFLKTTAVVPNSACNLHQIVNLEPAAPLDAAEQAILEAQAQVALASAQAGIATTKASEASASASTATTQAGISTTKAGEASASATTASTQAGIATTKAGEAASSASAASNSAGTATTQAGIATTQAGIATTQAGEASTSATTATTKAGEASTSASNAATSAQTATTKASEASASASTATTQAGIATTKAEEAHNSAVSSYGSAQTATTKADLATAKASDAGAYAQTATTQAGIATTKADEASVSAGTATTQAGIATTKANEASASAATATTQANTATTKANESSASAAAALASQNAAATSATNAAASAVIANTKAGEASGSAANALAIYGNTTAMNTAVSTAQAQASLAAGYAASAGSVAQQDLSAVSSTLHRSPNAITAMFLYDTSKDSDGGAWTEKCQHTSWYNEPLSGKWLGAQASEAAAWAVSGATTGDYFQLTTDGKFYKLNATSGTTEVFRGNKKSFPKVAAIVAEATSVTIYDLTEAGRPMFLRFTRNGTALLSDGYSCFCSAVSALNGYISLGTYSNSEQSQYGSLVTLNMISDYGFKYGGSSINAGGRGKVPGVRSVFLQGWQFLFLASSEYRLSNAYVNAVAMTVLPDAPVDPVTGLRVPTIAVATGGGISVIQNSGTVRNSSSTSSFTQITLTERLLSAGRADTTWYYAQNPGALGASFALTTDTNTAAPDFNDGNTTILKAKDRSTLARSSGAVVQLLRNNEATVGKGIGVKLSNTFNAGHLIGDIRRCFLSDVTTGSVTGPELVTNGTFDSDTTGWTATNGAISVSGGALRVTNTGTSYGQAVQQIAVTAGKAYIFSARTVSKSAGATYRISIGATNTQNQSILFLINNGSAEAAFKATVGAPTNSFYIFITSSIGTTDWIEVDNISVKEVIPDRSYKAAGANIYGTLTASAVNTGNSLVAYSGFSGSNYIQEPFSADLDFGTGEWSVGAWLNTTQPAVGGNLLTYSEQFDNGVWLKFRSSILSNAAVAPDGTLTADKLIEDTTATNSHTTANYGSQTVTAGAAYTFSAYVKAAERGYVTLVGDTSSGRLGANGVQFSLANGSVTKNSSSVATTSTNAGNGWWRFSITATAISSGTAFPLMALGSQVASSPNGQDSYTGDGTSGIYIWGAQLELGSVATDYKPTAATAILPVGALAHRSFSSGPEIKLQMTHEGKLQAVAFDGTTTRTVTTTAAYNTGTWTKVRATYTTDGTLGLTVNGQQVATAEGTPLLTLNSRYNLLNFSEQFDNAAWAKSGFGTGSAPVVTANYGLAPDGTQTADRIELSLNGGTAVGDVSLIQQTNTEAQQKTVSIHIKSLIGTPVVSLYEAGAGGNHVEVTATSEWQRFTYTPPVGANTAVGIRLRGTHGTSSTADILVWGGQLDIGASAKTYQRTTTVAETILAPLTIGNSYALDAPFPGSIALLKLSATVPTTEQAQWMYEQEKHLFTAGAQCVLPSSGNVLDLAYDDETDTWSALQATHESTWSGLVRTATQTPSAGSFAKAAATSGIKLLSRTTTNPGVDVQIPARNLKAELARKREVLNANQDVVVFDYFGGFTATTTNGSTALTSVAASLYPSTTNLIGCAITGTGIPASTVITGISGTTIYMSKAATANGSAIQISTTDFNLPVGYTARAVMTAGTLKREGSTADYTKLFDGFKETIRYAVAPGHNAWVQIQAVKEVV